MKYKCKAISLNKLAVTPSGFVTPLCNDCATKDCSHSIEKKKISILGIKKEVRLRVSGNEISLVVQCEGYTK